MSFEGLVGQEKAKEVLSILADAAKIRNAAVPHILFRSGPGNGKTTFAKAAAKMAGYKLHEANGGQFTSSNELEAVLSGLKEKDILFIDEIHLVSKKVATTILYTSMEDFQFTKLHRGKAIVKKLPNFTLIGATTDVGSMPKPLVSRFKFEVEFVKYKDEELEQIVESIFKANEMRVGKNLLNMIAKSSRGNPRLVKERAEFIRDYMLTNKSSRIDKKKIIDIMKLHGYDENGLRNIDREYLKLLENESYLSASSLASKLNVDLATITNDIEPFLIEKNMIEISSKGRSLPQDFGDLL